MLWSANSTRPTEPMSNRVDLTTWTQRSAWELAAIASACGVGAGTVSEYVRRARQAAAPGARYLHLPPQLAPNGARHHKVDLIGRSLDIFQGSQYYI